MGNLNLKKIKSFGKDKRKLNFMEEKLIWLLNEKYQGKLTKEFKKDAQLLKKGFPIDYLIGFVDFLGAKIDLSKKPFIPREETQFWVKNFILSLKSSKRKNLLILDLFSGSGAIGIALLKNLPKRIRRVDFGEKNPKFLEQIKINLKINKIPLRKVKVIQTDVFEKIKEKYHFILANPPYCDPKKKSWFQKSVLEYEPKEAVLAKDGGLYFIKKLIFEGKRYLKKGGKILFEFSFEQKEKIENLAKKAGFEVKFFKDNYNLWRMAMLWPKYDKF